MKKNNSQKTKKKIFGKKNSTKIIQKKLKLAKIKSDDLFFIYGEKINNKKFLANELIKYINKNIFVAFFIAQKSLELFPLSRKIINQKNKLDAQINNLKKTSSFDNKIVFEPIDLTKPKSKLNKKLNLADLEKKSLSVIENQTITLDKKKDVKKDNKKQTPVSLKQSFEKVSLKKIIQRKKKQLKARLITTFTYKNIVTFVKRPIFIFVLLPTIIFAFYQNIIASKRYESISLLIVQQPDDMATMDASMALMAGLGVNTTSTDTKLVEAYILSNDMLLYLDKTLNLRSHYSYWMIDIFSKLKKNSSKEDFMKYYQKRVVVEIDELSGVIALYTQGFNPSFAQKLNKEIVKRAEWYINKIGHDLASSQLKFVEGEHKLVETRLQSAQTNLLTFQQQNNLLDPTAEGAALQKITYGIENIIAQKEVELKSLESVMAQNAPAVVALNSELAALKEQLILERGRLSVQNNGEGASVSEILAKFSDHKVAVELALQAYSSSLISLEKSRIEAYRKLKYLVTVDSSSLPEDDSYPEVFFNVSLFFCLFLMIYFITRLIISIVDELG